MKQILHIFAKDARRLWLQILIQLLLTAALVLTYPRRWAAGAMMLGGAVSVSFSPRAALQLLPGLLTFFIPLNWWLLISPVIHGERLVGDRQFWLTRPYEWNKLFAAKALFLVVFLYFPILLAQCLLLAEAGFPPFVHLPGLLYILFLFTVILILPLAALSTVTKNLGATTLAVLGAVVCMIGISTITSMVPADDLPSPFVDHVALVLVVCGCIAAIVVQYATRKARVAWLLLISIMVLMAVIAISAPDQALMDRSYPPPTGLAAAPVQFAYREEPGVAPSAFVPKRRNEVGISIPVHAFGVAEGSIVIPDDVKATLVATDGSSWTSVWQPAYVDKVLPGDRMARANFSMPRSVYERLKSRPLQLHIVYAVTEAQKGNDVRVPLSLHDFSVPGFGICTPDIGFAGQPDEISGLRCRSALRQPGLTLVRAEWTGDPCKVASSGAHDMLQSLAWEGALDRSPADFGVVPVWAAHIDFSMGYNGGPRHLCPGTPAVFTPFSLVRRTQASLSVQSFQLPELSRALAGVIENP